MKWHKGIFSLVFTFYWQQVWNVSDGNFHFELVVFPVFTYNLKSEKFGTRMLLSIITNIFFFLNLL